MNPWTLHPIDCLDPVAGLASLADGSVDHVITDPPYSDHVHGKSMRGANGWKGEISVKRDLGFVSLDEATLTGIAVQAARIVRRWVIVFSDSESTHLWRAAMVAAGLEYIRTCVWVKVGGAPQFTGDRPAVAVEEITIAHPKGRKRWNGGGKAGIYSIPIVLERGSPQSEPRLHTAQKPEALMESLIRDFTDPGDLIIDPFAGSGTTGVAAIRLGRQFIGWEKNEEFAAIARRRLAGTREQLRMFEPMP